MYAIVAIAVITEVPLIIARVSLGFQEKVLLLDFYNRKQVFIFI